MAWITAMMEITPCEDIEMIIKQYNYLLEGIKIYDSTDKLLPLFPLEIMGSALFEYMANHIPNFVHGADFRETYRSAYPQDLTKCRCGFSRILKIVVCGRGAPGETIGV